MIRSRAPRPIALLFSIAAAAPALVPAATQTVYIDTLSAATTAPPLAAGDVLFVATHVRGQAGGLSHAVTFSVASGVTEVSGRATWPVSTAAGPGPRLVGVNFDIFDANQALVLSDSFSGVVGGAADSSFVSTPLAPGVYTLRATGTGVREAIYDLELEFGGTPPVSPSAETGSLPQQGATTLSPTSFFTTLQDTRSVQARLRHRDTVIVDTLVTTQTGALAHTVNFTPPAGIDRFIGDVVWITSSAVGTGPRLVGVNVDVVDANSALVASDAFAGTAIGFAHSTLAGTFGSGAHRIVMTGTGVRDSALVLSLSLIDDEGVFGNGFE